MNSNISPIIQSQIPSFLAGGDLSDFLISYYKWLESSSSITIGDISDLTVGFLENESEYTLPVENRQGYSALSSIKDYQDFQKTPAKLISKFVSEYMDGIPVQKLSSIRSSMGLMKNFYENRGNEKSFEFLFNLLFKEVISLTYPSDRIFKLSDSNWVERTYVRIQSASNLSDIVGKTIVATGSGATGVISGSSYHKLSDTGINRNYYRLALKDVTGTFSVGDTIDLADTTFTLLPGLSGLTYQSHSALLPTDLINISFVGGSDSVRSFGSQVKIKELEPHTLTNANVTVNVSGGNVSLINDFYEVYELESGLTIQTGDILTGQKSGAIATIVLVDGSRFWVKDLGGVLLSDYQVNGQGDSELVDVIDKDTNTTITTIRLRKKYSASEIPAQIFVESGVATIPYGGLNYRFNPIDENGIVTISGFGNIKEIEIPEMGYLGGQSTAEATIVRTGALIANSAGFNTGVTSTESFFESLINTLDGEAKLRDSNYYQEFSYEIKSQTPMNNWSATVSRMLHPAGMKLFGKEERVSAPFDLSLTDQSSSIESIELISLGPPPATSVSYDYGLGSIGIDGFDSDPFENIVSRLYYFTGENNLNASSFTTDYDDHLNSKTYFLPFSDAFGTADTGIGTFKNRVVKEYLDSSDGGLDTTENIDAWRTNRGIVGEVFETQEHITVDLFERGGEEKPQPAEKSTPVDMSGGFNDGNEGGGERKAGQGKDFKTKEDGEFNTDGSGGDDTRDRNGKDFDREFDSDGVGSDGDGGVVRVIKGVTHELDTYDSNFGV